MLTQDHKTHRIEVCQDPLHQFEAEGDKFLDNIVILIRDETCCHHYEPESKKTVHGVATSGFPKEKEVQDTVIGREIDVHSLLA